MEILLIILVITVVVLFTKKSKNTKRKEEIHNKQSIHKPNKNSPGMYFMELYEAAERQRKSSIETINNPYYEHIGDWFLTLAYACQGRILDVNDSFDYYKDVDCKLNKDYVNFMKAEKKQIYAMARIAQRIEDGPIGFDLKDGESIGEYTDRKLLKNKPFMEKYLYYVNFDFEKHYKLFHSYNP
jgi:hypothetical protein